ncbi:MAG: YlmH/Sll1252 family protein [Bacillota bacterium]|nr:YlmH/Sll1252 family protein [Bacillota bacterium]
MNQYLNNLAVNSEEKRLIARLDELGHRTMKGVPVVTDFLDLRQQVLGEAVAVQFAGIHWRMDGGYELAERKRLIFYPEWTLEADHEIQCVHIKTVGKNEEFPGHRDYLGAIMNLGMKREKLGDIVVVEQGAYVFIDQALTDYLCNQLEKVGNTRVTAAVTDAVEVILDNSEPVDVHCTVASLRVDSVLAATFRVSRGEAAEMIESGKVRVNQMEIQKSALTLKEGDLLSVRGKGRASIKAIEGISRKGRYRLQISKW